jgi:hypothetical protein
MTCVPCRVTAPLTLAALVLAGCGGGGSSSSFGGAAGSTAAVSTVAAPIGTSGTSAVPTPSTGAAAPTTTGPTRTSPQNLATGPAVVIDASGQGKFFDLPWPLDSRKTTSGGLDLSGLADPLGKQFVANAFGLAATDTRNASPTGTIYFRFDGPILAPTDDPLQSVAPGASVFVVCIDKSSPHYLERSPVHVAITAQADSVRPANLLEILPVPGHGLRPSTRYAAIVLRSLGGPGTTFLGQAPALTQLLAGQAPAGALGTNLAADYAALPQALLDLNLNPDDLAAASAFATGDPTASLVKQAAWADAQQPLAPTTPITLRDEYPAFYVLKGEYGPPQFQAGVPPFLQGMLTGVDDGRQVVDARGLPVTQWIDTAQFQISIPKGKMPAQGFPLYFWVHGTGGDPSQFADRGAETVANTPSPPGTGMASYLCPRGWAGACAAGPLSPSRIGILSAQGYIAYDFFNPVAMRDNFVQMILEMVLFRRLLLTTRIDPTLCPGTDASASVDGKIGFDPDTMIVGGQSLGSYLAGMLAALLPDWKGCVLTGAGGSWVEFPFGPKNPLMPSSVIDAFALPNGEQIDRFHPYVMAYDLALGPADNTHYLEKVLRDPLAGHNPPHVLALEGHGDQQVPENLQRGDILGLGLDLAGPEVLPNPPDQQDATVLPWGGLQALPYSVQGNRQLPGGLTRTAVFVRYEHDTVLGDGHYISFQLQAPKDQIGEFASDVSAGRVPNVIQH